MPSTTPNYGWTYPISSDDLNAGATSIGSLATGIDSSVSALATATNAKIVEDNSGNTATLRFGFGYITTDASGDIYPPYGSVGSRTIFMGGVVTGEPLFPTQHPSDTYKIRFYRLVQSSGITAFTGASSKTIYVSYVRWSV